MSHGCVLKFAESAKFVNVTDQLHRRGASYSVANQLPLEKKVKLFLVFEFGLVDCVWSLSVEPFDDALADAVEIV